MNEIHFVGFDAYHDKSFNVNSAGRSELYLLIFTHTPALIYVDNKPEIFPANTAVFYKPNTAIRYGACEDSYSDSWIRFSSDEPFAKDFPLFGQPFLVTEPEYVNNLIKLITWETSMSIRSPRQLRHSGIDVFTPSEDSEESTLKNQSIIDDLMRILFKKLNDSVMSKGISTHEISLLHLRREIANAPSNAWNIPDIAKKLNMSEGHFQSIYKAQFGISCMEDVINMRLRKAENLLSFTNQPIAEIAEQCGYNSQEHFSRQFKTRYGMTAGEFRRKGR